MEWWEEREYKHKWLDILIELNQQEWIACRNMYNVSCMYVCMCVCVYMYNTYLVVI